MVARWGGVHVRRLRPAAAGPATVEDRREGIAYPLLGPNGQARAYVKFFDELKVSPKRIDRTRWLIDQRIDTWAPELRGAPRTWVDTKLVGSPQGISFAFTCSLAEAVPGPTWLEAKFAVAEKVLRLDEELRRKFAEHLIRALALLERSDTIHGDLSPNNIIVNPAARLRRAHAVLDRFRRILPQGRRCTWLSFPLPKAGLSVRGAIVRRTLSGKRSRTIASAAPYSDRFGRDVLLVELLCFDESCDAEEPASQWSRQKIQSVLSRSALAQKLSHLVSDDLFLRPEDRRPSSCELARAWGIATPPRVKRRNAVPISVSPPTGVRAYPMLGSLRSCLQNTVFILWLVCMVQWGLVCALAPRLLLGVAPLRGRCSSWTLVGLCTSSAGGVGSVPRWRNTAVVLAFARSQPQLINLAGLRLRDPGLASRDAKRNTTTGRGCHRTGRTPCGVDDHDTAGHRSDRLRRHTRGAGLLQMHRRSLPAVPQKLRRAGSEPRSGVGRRFRPIPARRLPRSNAFATDVDRRCPQGKIKTPVSD